VKVAVDENKCQGHTLCAMSAPTVFELNDDDGHASVVRPDVPADLEGAVRTAQANCPERAILLSE
jgi:ferredoxin